MASTEMETVPGLESESLANVTMGENEEEEQVSEANGVGKQEEAEGAAENGNNEDFLNDDGDSDEDDFVVTIGEIKTNASFTKGSTQGTTGLAGGRPELDGTPSHKGVPIYDVDLASMEDKPWRKPGADITDYFNYGFNEDTWNQYCERQRKLRSEFGNNQEAINRALFSSISLPLSSTGVQQLSAISSGRQLVNILSSAEKPKINKVVIDLSKPPPMNEQPSVIRTIIGGTAGDPSHSINNSSLISHGSTDQPSTGGSSSNLISLVGAGGPPPTDYSIPPPVVSSTPGAFNGPPPMASDFSKPPPSIPSTAPSSGPPINTIPTATPTPMNLSQPPPMNMNLGTIKSAPMGECPPGVDEPEIPGVSTPPPGLSSFTPMGNMGGQQSQIGGFNPSIPPPGGRLPGMNVPPPSMFPQQQFLPPSGGGMNNSGVIYSGRPQPLFPSCGSAGFGGSSLSGLDGMEGGRRSGRDYRDRDRDRDRNYGGKDYSSGDSADESYRRKRRRRSRTPSVERSSRRRKDDKDRDRDTYQSSSASRRHDSPHDASASTSRSSKRKSDRDKDRDKDRSNTSDSKRRSRRSPDGEHAGSEQTDDRSERRRKKHDRSEKDKEKS